MNLRDRYDPEDYEAIVAHVRRYGEYHVYAAELELARESWRRMFKLAARRAGLKVRTSSFPNMIFVYANDYEQTPEVKAEVDATLRAAVDRITPRG